VRARHRASPRPIVVTLGGIVIDHVVNAEGRVSSHQMGGNAVYSAIGARLFAQPVGVVGTVPRTYPAEWLAHLSSHSIMTDGVESVDEEVTSTDRFVYAHDGSRSEHRHAPLHTSAADGIDPDGAQNPSPCADDPRTFAAFRRRHPARMDGMPPEFLLADGYHLAPDRLEVHRENLRRIRERDGVVTLDPGNYVDGIDRETLEELIAAVDAFLPSEKEVVAAFPGLSMADAIERIACGTDAAVAIKLGGRGSLVWDPRRRRARTIPAIRTRVVDPTGAGDAYCGGFLVGLMRSRDPVYAACCGTVAASFVIEHFGALHALGTPPERVAQRLSALVERVGEGEGGS
jgi:sugar/nucleoside kinase (ribokinase family)